MPRSPRLTCPKCDAPLILLAAVFDSLLEKVGSLLKKQPPLSQVFYCEACKHVVWWDGKGKKILKGEMTRKRKPGAKTKRRK